MNKGKVRTRNPAVFLRRLTSSTTADLRRNRGCSVRIHSNRLRHLDLLTVRRTPCCRGHARNDSGCTFRPIAFMLTCQQKINGFLVPSRRARVCTFPSDVGIRRSSLRTLYLISPCMKNNTLLVLFC